MQHIKDDWTGGPFRLSIDDDPWSQTEEAAQLPADIGFLLGHGYTMSQLADAVKEGQRFAVPASTCLIARGIISEADYYRIAAQELGLSFALHHREDQVRTALLPSPADFDKLARIVAVEGDGLLANRRFFVAPDMRQANPLRNLLARQPAFANRMVVCPPSSNRQILIRRYSEALLRRAQSVLKDNAPVLSAYTVLSPQQTIWLVLLAQVIAFLSVAATSWLALAFHLFASFFYLACVALRLVAAVQAEPMKRRLPPVWDDHIDRSDDPALPVYSVLCAVYREANQMEDLVQALSALDWPRHCLDIRIVCEVDDRDTIAAAQRAVSRRPGCGIEVVEVPVAAPRTKPKALNYALPLCKGEYLVIYDAEDRPDPRQLRQAHDTFRNADPGVACLQAPLIVHNHRESWLARMFTIEYSALFDGLLPALANRRLPLPLGGTSNHFRTSALRRIGAWDPFNVTEDADLGIRLGRYGYRIETITRPTYEEAPVTFPVWLRQRTRWFKGWLQTWLVHMRTPIATSRQLGWRGSIAFHLMITGMIVSALVHPILLISAGFWVADMVRYGAISVLTRVMFWFDFLTILLGYLAFIMLAWQTLPARGLSRLRIWLFTLPLYWPLLSIAAWRAVWHLVRRPHEWEKTPHRLQSMRSLRRSIT